MNLECAKIHQFDDTHHNSDNRCLSDECFNRVFPDDLNEKNIDSDESF